MIRINIVIVIAFLSSCKSPKLFTHYHYNPGTYDIWFNQSDSTFTLAFWHLGNDTISGSFERHDNLLTIIPYYAKVIKRNGITFNDSIRIEFQMYGGILIANETLIINNKTYISNEKGVVFFPLKLGGQVRFQVKSNNFMEGRGVLENNGKYEYTVILRTPDNSAEGFYIFKVHRKRLRQNIEGQTIYWYPMSTPLALTMPNK